MAIQVNSRFTTSADCGGPPPCARIWASDMIAALERVHRLRAVHNFGAVNISIGGGGFTAPCDDDPRKFIIDNLRAADIATVISSGNGGFTNALSAPACISTAVSVGNTTKSDTVGETSNVASFLSLFAPGTSIASSVPGGGFASFVGTSMAAPHVAGAFAILKQAIPGATVGHLLQALQLTGRPIADVTGIVKSRVHVDAALSAFTPFAAIEANGPAFRAGQALTLNLTADNPPGNPTFDLYVGALFPDGNSIAFLTAPNLFGGAGQLSSPAGVRPMMALGAGVTVNTVVLQSAFPAAGLPAGTYRAFAALVRQGALADNAWNDGDLVWLDVVDVAYAP
jgi:subtilisin family serine protease